MELKIPSHVLLLAKGARIERKGSDWKAYHMRELFGVHASLKYDKQWKEVRRY